MRQTILILLTLFCLLTGNACVVSAGKNYDPGNDQVPSQLTDDAIIAGYIENVSFKVFDQESFIVMEAKLDTGADSSSLHATDIKINKSKKSVSFTLIDQHNKEHRITCPYARIVRIKTRPSGYQRRPVIPIQLQIGSKRFDAFVNLTDRSNFSYKMLIGRKELRHGILIDSSSHHRLTLPENNR